MRFPSTEVMRVVSEKGEPNPLSQKVAIYKSQDGPFDLMPAFDGNLRSGSWDEALDLDGAVKERAVAFDEWARKSLHNVEDPGLGAVFDMVQGGSNQHNDVDIFTYVPFSLKPKMEEVMGFNALDKYWVVDDSNRSWLERFNNWFVGSKGLTTRGFGEGGSQQDFVNFMKLRMPGAKFALPKRALGVLDAYEAAYKAECFGQWSQLYDVSRGREVIADGPVQRSAAAVLERYDGVEELVAQMREPLQHIVGDICDFQNAFVQQKDALAIVGSGVHPSRVLPMGEVNDDLKQLDHQAAEFCEKLCLFDSAPKLLAGENAAQLRLLGVKI